MENVLEKYNINPAILELISANSLDKAIDEYSLLKNIPQEQSREIIYRIKKIIDGPIVVNTDQIVEERKKVSNNIFGNNIKYNEQLLSKYPDWDIEPPNQLVNPRLKK